jgi:hypothetical protein
MIFVDLGPLGLYKDINDARPRARDSCTSYATENTDYLTKYAPLLSTDSFSIILELLYLSKG